MTAQTWVSYAEAARAARVRTDLLWQWVRRDKVRARGARWHREVVLEDVLHAERAWRQRARRRASASGAAA